MCRIVHFAEWAENKRSAAGRAAARLHSEGRLIATGRTRAETKGCGVKYYTDALCQPRWRDGFPPISAEPPEIDAPSTKPSWDHAPAMIRRILTFARSGLDPAYEVVQRSGQYQLGRMRLLIERVSCNMLTILLKDSGLRARVPRRTISRWWRRTIGATELCTTSRWTCSTRLIHVPGSRSAGGGISGFSHVLEDQAQPNCKRIKEC
jgi:hypothetical protein